MPAKIVLTCLVDNNVQGLSFWGEHGLTFLVESVGYSLLFDTGQSGAVLAHNLAAARRSGDKIRSIVLSHGHIDHTGGLRTAMAWAPGAQVVAHPGVFVKRFARQSGREGAPLESLGIPVPREEIESRTQLRLTPEVTEIAPGIWATGEVPRAIDGGTPAPRVIIREGESWRTDPVLDDQSLVLDTAQGLLLLLGCCHAGLLNTLEHVRRSFGSGVHCRRSAKIVVGGTHLGPAKAEQLKQIAAALRDDYGVEKLYLNHCTGPAIWPLMQLLGDQVRPCPVGTRLKF